MTRGEVALIVAQKGLSVGMIGAEYFTAVILCCFLMHPGHSPGARSGAEFSRWFVDVVNGSAVAWCESSPRASARSERTIKDHLDFYCTPLRRLSARRKGGGAPCFPRRAPNMVFPVSC